MPALTIGLINVLVISMLLVIGRVLLRRDWLVWVVIWIVASIFATPNHDAHPIIDLLIAAISMSVALLLIIRYGIFVFAVANTVWALIWLGVPSLDFSRWYALPSVLTLVIVAAIAAYGFRAALAGRSAFGRSLLEE
jgi:hypothetical protein